MEFFLRRQSLVLDPKAVKTAVATVGLLVSAAFYLKSRRDWVRSGDPVPVNKSCLASLPFVRHRPRARALPFPGPVPTERAPCPPPPSHPHFVPRLSATTASLRSPCIF